MKERPIIFKGEMVKAILEGRKTMTRRMMRKQPTICEFYEKYDCWFWNIVWPDGNSTHGGGGYNGLLDRLKAPWFPGDRLWVKETWACKRTISLTPTIIYSADGIDKIESADGKWHSSIFMPKWASRITLEIKNIRVERVQEITEEDAIKERVADFSEVTDGAKETQSMLRWPQRQFQVLWDSIHGKGAWERNDLVWVIEFKRI